MSLLNLGLSGCKLEKISPEIIRKYSKDNYYNSRLLKQINKQDFFIKNFYFSNIKSPLIIGINQDNDLNYFDMVYSHGLNYNQYFNTSDPIDILNFYDCLKEYIDFFININQFYSVKEFKDLIIQKLTSLTKDSEHKKIINILIRELNFLNLNDIPKSFCHGDFSMSNLLFENKYYILIDFLDSFVDTIFIDLAKLKQDLYYKWIMKINDDDSMQINIAFDFLWYKLEKDYSKFLNSDAFNLIDFINLLRIEPYIEDNKKIYLNQCLEKHQFYVNFNLTNGRSILPIS